MDGPLTVNNEEELEDAIEELEDANLDDLPSFEYPITIIKDDGTTQTINNNTELATALEEC